jgi:RNA polymerase sigma-70 factor (ECF subfamily)
MEVSRIPNRGVKEYVWMSSSSGKQEKEERLVRYAKARDEQAFAELTQCYSHQLLIYLTRMLGDEDEAEDVLQDTLIEMWCELPHLDNDASFKSWLYRIAINNAHDRHRRKNRFEWIPWEEKVMLKWLDVLRRPDLEQEVVDTAITNLALQQVNENYRATLLLRMIGGFSPSEIAQLLGYSPKSIHKMMKRGVLEFKEACQSVERKVKADMERRA